MPQPHKNAPDQHDTYNMCAAIGEEWGYIVEFTCRYYADYVQVIARARKPVELDEGKWDIQALSKTKYGKKQAREQIEFTLAFDLWCQLDGGGATAAQRGPAFGWDGRVEVPHRRGAK